jgi:hypothetical protein
MRNITLLFFVVFFKFASIGQVIYLDPETSEKLNRLNDSEVNHYSINDDDHVKTLSTVPANYFYEITTDVDNIATPASILTGSGNEFISGFEKELFATVLVNVTTNSGDSPEGALVTLANQDTYQYEYTATADKNGEAHFESVRNGLYIVHISLPFHHDYISEGVDIQNDFTYNAELIEIIQEPFGLMVDTENVGEGEALFSWNNVMGWSESFEEGSMPEGWSQVITNTGSGTEGDHTWHITGEVTLSEGVIVPPDGEYQAFIMWSSDHQDEWLITPEFTAPADDLVFWYFGTNGSPYGDNYYVKVTTNGGDSWDILWNASDLPEADNHYEVPAVIDLSDFAGQEIKIAWNNVDGDGQGLWYAWAIDNISVGNMKIDVRDLVHESAVKSTSGHNHSARDGMFRSLVDPVDLLIQSRRREFMGFNVFLNDYGSSIGSMGNSYMFIDVPPGINVAGVQAVYTSGLSDIITIEFEMQAPDEQFARAQIIHNSADESVASVDIFLNGEEFLNGVGFRQATAFMDIPAATDLIIHIAPEGTGIDNAAEPFYLNLTPNETYVIIASGIVDYSGHNPAKGFDLFIYDQAREAAVNVMNTDVMVFHGVTDAPKITVFEQNIDNKLMMIDYGQFSEYLPLTAQDYVFEIRDAEGVEVIAVFNAPLASLGFESDAIVIVASGFLNPENNNNGPEFGLWIADTDGGDLIKLQLNVGTHDADMFVGNISMFPNPANNVVNIKSTAVISEIRLVDLRGRIVYSENINTERYQINTSQFYNGIYLIQVVTSEGMFMDKLQIQN